jgi:tetratricopeptide (TPR) repeat protein
MHIFAWIGKGSEGLRSRCPDPPPRLRGRMTAICLLVAAMVGIILSLDALPATLWRIVEAQEITEEGGEEGKEEEGEKGQANNDIRLYDRVTVKGSDTPIEGTIIEEDAQRIKLKKRDSAIIVELKKTEIANIERRETPGLYYERKAKGITPGDARARCDLARWCLKYELDGEAEAELQKAIAENPKMVEAYELLAEIYRLRRIKSGGSDVDRPLDGEAGVYLASEKEGVWTPGLGLRRGQFYEKLGLLSRALEELERVRQTLLTLEASPVAREATPLGTGEATPLGTGDVTPLGTGDVTPLGTGDVTPLGTGGATPVGKGDASPPAPGEATGPGGTKPVGTGEASPLGTGDVTPLGTGEASPVGTVETGDATQTAEEPARRGLSPDERVLLDETLLGLGRIHLVTKDYAAALKHYEELLTRDPTHLAGLQGAGKATYGLGRADLSMEYFNRAATDPASEADATLIRLNLGIASYALDDLARTEDIVAKLADATGAASVPASYYLGLSHLRRGMLKSAKIQIYKCLKEDPSFYRAHLAMGFVREMEGKPDAALEEYGKAGKLAPADGFVPYLAGTALASWKKHAEAEVKFKEALRLGFHFGETLKALGQVQRVSGRLKESVRSFLYIIENQPDATPIRYELGLSYLHLGELEAATEQFRKVLQENPESANAQIGEGYVAYRKGEYGKAEEIFARVLEKSPDHAYAKTALRNIREARTRKLWSDDFERADSEVVKNHWIEDERFGVEIGISGKKVRFTGRQSNQPGGKTRLERKIEGKQLASFEVRLNLDGATEARAGLRIESDHGTIVLFKNKSGEIEYYYRIRAKEEHKGIGTWPAGDHWVSIKVDEAERDLVRFLLDGRELAQCKVPGFRRARSYSAVLYGDAEMETEWTLRVDEVKIYVLKEGGRRVPEKY